MCCDLILRRRLGKRGKRPQRAYERDGDFAGLLALDLCREIQNSKVDVLRPGQPQKFQKNHLSLDLEMFLSRLEDFRAKKQDRL